MLVDKEDTVKSFVGCEKFSALSELVLQVTICLKLPSIVCFLHVSILIIFWNAKWDLECEVGYVKIEEE